MEIELKTIKISLMEIWAHTLVKNDARWLWYSVNSVIDHIDKLLLWDTGSVDDSLEIERELKSSYPDKILYFKRPQNSKEEFTDVRQEMLEATLSDWFLMLDADEIWWRSSIEKVINKIKTEGQKIESIVVPTVNTVGDIFHYQDNNAGRYKFGSLTGHYNLRAINKNIPGLRSQGVHGVWGWADKDGKMIQDRNPEKVVFVDAPYLHTTFLKRSSSDTGDTAVIKRHKKLKYEIGKDFPSDYFYPEVYFEDKPVSVKSPWQVMDTKFKARSYVETPLRQLKRKYITGKPGY